MPQLHNSTTDGYTNIPCGTAECWEIANSQSANWLSEGKFPYSARKLEKINKYTKNKF